MDEADIRKRLLFLTPATIELYCKLFGYSEIVVEDGAEVFLGEHNSAIIRSAQFQACHDKLFVALDKEGIEKKCDVISVEQLAHDLQVLSEVPSYLFEHMNEKSWLAAIGRFLAGYHERGWNIVVSLRPNLLNKMHEEAFFLELECLSVSNDLALFESLKEKTFILCDGPSRAVDDLYESNKSMVRVERYWLAYFLREWVAELLLEHYSTQLAPYNVSLISANWAWGFDHFLGRLHPRITSAEIEERSKYSKASIARNPELYKEYLSHILNCSIESAVGKFNDISQVPLAIEVFSGTARQADFRSACVNVVDGARLTYYTPQSCLHRVFLIGGCTFFGYAIEDSCTFASYLQKELNRAYPDVWEVVNLALWGGNFDQCYKRLDSLPLRSGDVVIVSHAFGNVLSPDGVLCVDMSAFLNDVLLDDNSYWDRIVHCGSGGYSLIASKSVELLAPVFAPERALHLTEAPQTSQWLEDRAEEQDSVPAMEEFIREVQDQAPSAFSEKGTIGAIVMNCNPFTLGHLFLIETASHAVDYLYVFVVEEDRSVFPFKDRIRLVREGTAHLENVYVHRSGSFIISSTTFPEYFTKEASNTIDVDVSTDLEIFGKRIAPALGITKRFVGEEPFDLVTRRYNEDMKTTLPSYGIELIEIPRKTIEDQELVISATTVRKLLADKRFDELSRLVPETTLRYLMGKQKY